MRTDSQEALHVNLSMGFRFLTIKAERGTGVDNFDKRTNKKRENPFSIIMLANVQWRVWGLLEIGSQSR